ncbi:MAG TPA: ice-binding family protein, partial [Rhodoferax sp.]|nr:ice-binding family protein [Rhodoferax sp.]
KATFNEAMNPLTINTDSFTLTSAAGPVAGTVTLGPLNKNATFTPNANLAVGTEYTATITMASKDQAGNPLVSAVTWKFTTADVATVGTGIDLDTATPFGTFGGTAGMTNMGINTIVNGNIGTIATGTTAITGFHETTAYGNDIYTETTLNIGAVNGVIYTCTNSVTGANSAGPSAPECAAATQARLDAETAYLALVAKPVGGASPAPGANLAGITLQPGTYKAPDGSFMIQGGDLTLDAKGDANATWVFQMATTLTVGGPGAAFPQSIILAGGAQAKNVFWQVGSTATINAAGGGTVVGTIIAQAGVNISTAGNVNIVTLNGRALSLGASVTMVNTVINVPAQ